MESEGEGRKLRDEKQERRNKTKKVNELEKQIEGINQTYMSY